MMEYYSYNYLLIFEINTKVNTKMSVFWEFTLPILADIYDFQKNPLPHSSELFPLISLYLFARLDGVISLNADIFVGSVNFRTFLLSVFLNKTGYVRIT